MANLLETDDVKCKIGSLKILKDIVVHPDIRKSSIYSFFIEQLRWCSSKVIPLVPLIVDVSCHLISICFHNLLSLPLLFQSALQAALIIPLSLSLFLLPYIAYIYFPLLERVGKTLKLSCLNCCSLRKSVTKMGGIELMVSISITVHRSEIRFLIDY